MTHDSFLTTTHGLRRGLPPMRLFEKAKRFGIWNPSDIDLSQDQRDWRSLTADEQDILLRLSALFQAGEEAVTLDLLPLIIVIAQEGRLEEEMYLTSFLWEEAKHVEFFSRGRDRAGRRVKLPTGALAQTFPRGAFMPIYEYTCTACGQHFDHYWRSIRAAEEGQAPPCPACASSETQRIMSQVAVLGGIGGLTPGEQAASAAQQERLASITPKEQIDKLRAGKKKDA